MMIWADFHHTTMLLERACGGALHDLKEHHHERALELGVNTQLYRYAQHMGVALPGKATRWWRAHLARVMAKRHALLEVTAKLNHHKLRHAVIKGSSLSMLLYDDEFMRRSSDIDLLVDWEDATKAAEVLKDLGYKAQIAPRPWLDDEWAFVHPETGQVIELHGALAVPRIPAPATSLLLSRGVRCAWTQEHVISVLDEADVGLVVFLHAHRHLGAFKGMLDMASWVDRFSAQEDIWALFLTRAHTHGLYGVVSWGCAAIGAPDLAPAPQDVWARILGRWFFARAQGVLCKHEAILGNDPMSFKTQETTQWETMLWHMLGMSLMDGWCHRMVGVWKPIFRNPQSMALDRGSNRVELMDYMAVLMRPLSLLRKYWKSKGRTNP